MEVWLIYPVRNNAPPVESLWVERLEFLTGFTLIVIPGLTRNPVFLNWIPAGVYPVPDTGRE